MVYQARPQGFEGGGLSVHKHPGILEMISEKSLLFNIIISKRGSDGHVIRHIKLDGIICQCYGP